MKEENEPLLITKYEKKRLIPYLFIAILTIFLFGFGALFYCQQPGESYLEYLLTRIGSVLLFLWIMYSLIDLLNTKEFRIYEDRIGKIARVLKGFPLIGNRVVYYDNAYYARAPIGIRISNQKSFINLRGFLLAVKFLSREDQEKVADIFSRLSGKGKEFFLRWGVTSSASKFKDDGLSH
ncbi:hypothetical protein [Phorcysia thermohydrogeniphila]|uniref:Uncharacterized protein n=1 Tax=Phorcysia thermohydrogeniphila TaxID=936138 RepID=A0A4R1GPZ8_9BACT|nr:hypothetical protein [Phorcysia thermohydrogeniphila]TCK06582.1 hypothetical protein CLV27_0384 [Phorcysia thermohydrogeniphila]